MKFESTIIMKFLFWYIQKTVLHVATENNNFEVVNLLLSNQKININIQIIIIEFINYRIID